MKDGIDLDRASGCPPEEHPPVAHPEAKGRSIAYPLDVAKARSGVMIDAGNDACSRWRVDPSQVTAGSSGRTRPGCQPTLLPSPPAGDRRELDAVHAVNAYASTVILMFEGSTPNDRASPRLRFRDSERSFLGGPCAGRSRPGRCRRIGRWRGDFGQRYSGDRRVRDSGAGADQATGSGASFW